MLQLEVKKIVWRGKRMDIEESITSVIPYPVLIYVAKNTKTLE